MKALKKGSRILALMLAIAMLVVALPSGAMLISSADADPFEALKAPIKYEAEDFAPEQPFADNIVGHNGAFVKPWNTSGTNNDSVASGRGEAGFVIPTLDSYITVTLDDIPVSGYYRVSLSTRSVDAQAQAYLRKDADSPRASEQVRMKGDPGGDQNSYLPRSPKTEGVIWFDKGSSSFDIVCDVVRGGSDNNLRLDYIEILLVEGDAKIYTAGPELKETISSNTEGFRVGNNDDTSTVWGTLIHAFLYFDTREACTPGVSTIDYALTGIDAGDYYFKTAFKPRNNGMFLQVLADDVEVGAPFDIKGAGNNNFSNPDYPSCTSNVQTIDTIITPVTNTDGNLKLTYRIESLESNSAEICIPILKMWFYPVPKNTSIVTNSIASLPSVDDVTEADLDEVNETKALFDALSENEQTDVANADKLADILAKLAGEEEEDLTLSIRISSRNESVSETKFDAVWSATVLVGGSDEQSAYDLFNDADIQIKEYGIFYGISTDAVSKWADFATDPTLTTSLRQSVFGTVIEGEDNIKMFTSYGFRLRNCTKGVTRAAMFYVNYVYNGTPMTATSTIDEITG